MIKVFSLLFGILFFCIFIFGSISPSICEYSGNCLTSVNFYLIGGIGFLLIMIGLIWGERDIRSMSFIEFRNKL